MSDEPVPEAQPPTADSPPVTAEPPPPAPPAPNPPQAAIPSQPTPQTVPQTAPQPTPPAPGVAAAIAPPGWWATPPRPGAPLTPGFLKTRWPGPTTWGDVAVLPAVLAGALGFAVFLPLGRTGIGWFLAALVAAAAVGVVASRSQATLPTSERIIRALWGVAALALLSVLAFRNAWWLVTFCVLGSLACAALAIVGGRSIRSILFSTVAAPLAAFRGLPWVSRHGEAMRRSGGKPGVGKRFGWSLAVTVVLLLVFGALFASADAAFSELLGQVTPQIDGPVVVSWLFLLLVGALVTVAGVYLVWAPPDLSGMDTPSRRRLGVAEWILPIAALVALFAGFVAVQLTVLFGGSRHVLETAHLSYAQYARTGFWQLIVVTLLTLLIISAMARWASRETPQQRNLLRVFLGLLCALSVVIVVSALFRMYTYQKAYSFTGERIFVMAFELLLGSVFILIMLAGIRWQGAWIPRLVAALAVVMLLSLAVMNPEGYAAQRNVNRFHDIHQIDPWYLRALSADATPVLAQLPYDLRQCTLQWIAGDLADDDPWYAWNLGRQRAREELKKLGPDATGQTSAGASYYNFCAIGNKYDFPKTRD